MAATLARAAALIAATPRTAPDRRRFRRTSIALGGRMLSARGHEYDCRTTDISPGGARLVAAEQAHEGDRVVIYLDAIGRTPATIVRAHDGEFGVVFETTAHKREKIAEHLTWLMNKDRFSPSEVRRAPRHDTSAHVTVTLDDGKTLACDAMDFSVVGASLRTKEKRPEIGAWVMIGHTYGRVSRYLDDGFAVDFQPPASRRG